MRSLPPVLTVEEAGQLIRLGRTQAYELARAGCMPLKKIGTTRFVPTETWCDLIGLSEYRIVHCVNGPFEFELRTEQIDGIIA